MKTKSVSLLLALLFSQVAIGTPVADVLTNEARETTPIFTIGTIHSPTDAIVSVLATACNFAASNFDDCYHTDNNGSLALTGTLPILSGQTIGISVPALAGPLNFWQVFYPYSTPHVAVRITNTQGQDCDSTVVAYDCPTSSTCPGLSFSPSVECNFN